VCLAIPGQIIEISSEQPQLARVDVGGVRRNINIGLLEPGEAAPGQWILIHVGFALSTIDETEAADQLRMLRAMGEDALAIEEVRGYSFGDNGGGADSGDGAASGAGGAGGDGAGGALNRETAGAAEARR
jgi:hydrogenase expression/formation protein HypC